MTDDDAAQVRGLLGLVADRVPDHPDLIGGVHGRAGRIVRRRRVAAGVSGLVAVAAVVALLPGARNGTVRPVDPAGAGSSTATAPAPGPGAPSWSEDFDGAALDRRRWTAVYDGGRNSPSGRWSARDVSVAGGAAHLAVSHTGASPLPATSGGMGALTSSALTGRWEVRMRMTGGNGVIGQFALVGERRDGVAQTVPRYLATLNPGAGELTVRDEAAGRDATRRISPGDWHTVALELTPSSVRWQVDGATIADWSGRPGAERVWPALQSLLAGPDCGAATLPADCGGHRTPFPQELAVSRIRFWAG